MSLLGLLLAFASSAACGHSSATAPSTTIHITSISPAQLTASASPQLVQFQGDGFQSGLQLEVTDPTGATVDASGSQIQDVTATAFEASVVFATAGTYRLAVAMSNGDTSDAFSVTVSGSVASGPTINNVSPQSTLHSSLSQVVSLTGANFTTSPTVFVSDPNGTTTQFSAGSLSGVTDSSIQFSMVFNKIGLWVISVVAASGSSSNLVTVTVQ